jgi:hypothetical protein
MKFKFKEAVFTSSKKDFIESTAEDVESGELVALDVATDLEDPIYLELLEQFTIDEISDMTAQKHEFEAATFTTFVKQMALDYGLVYDPNAADQQDRLTIDNLFNPGADERAVDFLFDLKIKIFDIPEVAESINTELKKQLREADSPLKSLYIAGKFLYE